MEVLAVAAVIVCFTLAINVGGNNSAAEMGPAFGAGVRSRKEAVLLIAVFSILGAILAGGHVVQTIGSDLIPIAILQTHLGSVIIILISATSIIAFANCLRVPIATSHAMVGSVIGMGVYYGHVNWGRVIIIVAWWVVTPLVSLLVSYLLGRFVYARLASVMAKSIAPGRLRCFYRVFITLSGCYIAFSAGSNSLAKAVGPIVGAGIVTPTGAAVLGGLGMAAGSLIVGHRLLQTVGKGITTIDPLKATLIELVCGTLILIASRAGVPVSLAEIITCSVIGFSCAHTGIATTVQNKHVRSIYRLWPACPLMTAATTFIISSVVGVFYSL